jgi:hypothetical protein
MISPGSQRPKALLSGCNVYSELPRTARTKGVVLGGLARSCDVCFRGDEALRHAKHFGDGPLQKAVARKTRESDSSKRDSSLRSK